MLDLLHLPNRHASDVWEWSGSGGVDGTVAAVWNRPRGATQLFILMIGPGGNGGNGFAGANNAASGGGGGSGSQSVLQIPALALPECLFVVWSSSAITLNVAPDNLTSNRVLGCNAGGNGGNGGAGVAGTAGGAASAWSVPSPPAGLGRFRSVSGQAGTAGGTSGQGASMTIPATGLVVCAGTGGAGLGAAAGSGNSGGLITGGGVFLDNPGGPGGGPTSTDAHGSNALLGYAGVRRFVGATGGGSGGGTSGNGGNGGSAMGMPGCGGGGGGACLTGFTPGVGGRGGPAYICIVAS